MFFAKKWFFSSNFENVESIDKKKRKLPPNCHMQATVKETRKKIEEKWLIFLTKSLIKIYFFHNFRGTTLNRSLHRTVWGEFSFFLSVLSTFSKFDEKNRFFAKNIFVALTNAKTAIYQKKKGVTICHHPSRTFEKTWRSHPYVFGNCFTLNFPTFFCFIKVNSFFPNNSWSSA